MTRRYGIFLSSLFCAFLFGLMALHLLLPDRERSQVENRTLAQRPALTLSALADGSFMEEAEEYIQDQFPARDGWTGLKARAERLLGKREFHNVYLCGDTLISRVADPAEGLETKNLERTALFAERVEVPVYLGLIPTAAEVWREKLPAGAESWDQPSFLRRAAELEGVETIGFLAALTAHGGEDIYYRTDHHWTTLGAYYGYTALMGSLGRGEEILEMEAFQRRPLTGAFQGTLYSLSGVHWLPPDTIESWVEEDGLEVISWRDGTPREAPLYDLTKLETKDKYGVFLGGNQPLCQIRNGEGTGSLLLIRDSYADALAPFLAQHFAQVHLMDLRYYRGSPAQYVQENGIDAVCVCYSVPNFIADRDLALLAR